MTPVPAPAYPPLLAVRNLGFSRDGEPLFAALDFAVEAGEALLVRGDNGVGKTTLLRILAGLLRADGGEQWLSGTPACRDNRPQHMAYLGHLPAFKGDLSALENLQFLCALHGKRADRGLPQAIDLVGLAGFEDSPARTLSAGQKKRLSLARMWLSPAPLWLLDEPYANLDLDGIALVNQLIVQHLQASGAALITTHGAYAAPPVRSRELVMQRAFAGASA
ncbi:heme ABC transporter ATP-binding protein CcmA [Lysobacteraceae bacterium NML07-0707]|nr:heme ABC transporter ATP-binding protein CcmA [Xanthomonadaceae bacterium NML07-0707]